MVGHDQLVLDALDVGLAGALQGGRVRRAVVGDHVVDLEALTGVDDDLDEVAAAVVILLELIGVERRGGHG